MSFTQGVIGDLPWQYLVAATAQYGTLPAILRATSSASVPILLPCNVSPASSFPRFLVSAEPTLYQPWPNSEESRPEAVIAAVAESVQSPWIQRFDWSLPYWLADVATSTKLPKNCQLANADESWVLTLMPSYEATLRDKFSCSARQYIRRAARNNVCVTAEPSSEDISQFAVLWGRCYEQNGWQGIRYNGEFFQNVVQLFPGAGRLVLAKINDMVIGGALVLDEAEGSVYYAAALDRNYKDAHAMSAVVDHVVRDLCAKGKRYLNFGGIGSNQKLAAFKARWGAEPKPIKRLVHSKDTSHNFGRRHLVRRLCFRGLAASFERARRRIAVCGPREYRLAIGEQTS